MKTEYEKSQREKRLCLCFVCAGSQSGVRYNNWISFTGSSACSNRLCTSAPSSTTADWDQCETTPPFGTRATPRLPDAKRMHVIQAANALDAKAQEGVSCKLPAQPLNSHWVCVAKDGKRVAPFDVGFFMYSLFGTTAGPGTRFSLHNLRTDDVGTKIEAILFLDILRPSHTESVLRT